MTELSSQELDWFQNLEWNNKCQEVKKILFVCGANTTRSPIAEFYFNKLSAPKRESFSRGIIVDSLNTLQDKLPKAIFESCFALDKELLILLGNKEIGEFAKKHRSKQISSDDINSVDLVLTMGVEIKNKLKEENKEQAFKIFTILEFINAGKNSEVGVENPFVAPHEKYLKGWVEVGRNFEEEFETYFNKPFFYPNQYIVGIKGDFRKKHHDGELDIRLNEERFKSGLDPRIREVFESSKETYERYKNSKEALRKDSNNNELKKKYFDSYKSLKDNYYPKLNKVRREIISEHLKRFKPVIESIKTYILILIEVLNKIKK